MIFCSSKQVKSLSDNSEQRAATVIRDGLYCARGLAHATGLYTSITLCQCMKLSFGERHELCAKHKEKHIFGTFQAQVWHVLGAFLARFMHVLGTFWAQFRHNYGMLYIYAHFKHG